MSEENIQQQLEKRNADELLRLQRLPEAQAAYTQLCKQNPTDYLAWLNLGAINGMLGDLESAEASFRKVTFLRSDVPQAHFNLAQLCAMRDRLDEACEHWRDYLKLQPGDGQAHAQFGMILHNLRRLNEAESALREALKLQPGSAEHCNALGVILQDLGRYDEALSTYHRALQLKPEMDSVYCNLGNLHHERNEDALAEKHYASALKLNPLNAGTHMSLGHHYARRAQFDLALQCFREALRLQPDYASAHWNLALLLLLLGQYREGWQEFEWRFRSVEARQQFGVRHFSRPEWDGVTDPEKTVLVYAEQGLGDTLQFCRYLPLVMQRAKRVIFECQPELLRLLQSMPGVCELIPRRNDVAEPVVEYDAQIPMMSLPRIFGAEIETIPSAVPYIRPDVQLVADWQQRLASHNVNVGLVWAGNPGHWRDRQRSLPLAAFVPLAQIQGVSLYSLQKGATAVQVATVPVGMKLIDLAPELDDFATTTAVIANLDLVITVDTAVAHLAGAMGVPVWNLITSPPDWRWLLEREDSPWYPSMRLFRQETVGDWSLLIERVAEDLRSLVHSKNKP